MRPNYFIFHRIFKNGGEGAAWGGGGSSEPPPDPPLLHYVAHAANMLCPTELSAIDMLNSEYIETQLGNFDLHASVDINIRFFKNISTCQIVWIHIRPTLLGPHCLQKAEKQSQPSI